MRRLLALLLVLASVMGMPVLAEEVTEPTQNPTILVREADECGDDLRWRIEGSTLTISGTGKMDDFAESAPWADRKSEITNLVLDGVTYIGANAFKNFDDLTEVDFGKDLYEIGASAFENCDGLISISLPESFKVFGPSSFQSCTKLTEIHCAGKFPSFRQNCLWGVYCKIYFPAERPWGSEYIIQLEEAFHYRIEFLASDGSDPVTETQPEETEEVTVPPTEPPTEVPTAAPTEAPTEAAAEPTAAPTAASTELPTEEATQEPSVAPPIQQEGYEPRGISVGLIIVGAVLLFLGLGALTFALSNRRRGRYSNRKNRGKYRR